MVGGHKIAVLTASLPDDNTTVSTFLWNASSGRLTRSCTAVQSLYSLSDHSPSLLSSRMVSQQRIPAPPVCSQNPGFSFECPDARPLAIAFAAPSWSDASAVSGFNKHCSHVPVWGYSVRMTTSALAASFSNNSESSNPPRAILIWGNASFTGLAFSSGFNVSDYTRLLECRKHTRSHKRCVLVLGVFIV